MVNMAILDTPQAQHFMKTHVFSRAEGFYDTVLGAGPFVTITICLSVIFLLLLVAKLLAKKFKFLEKGLVLIEKVKKALMWNSVFQSQI